MIPGGFYEWRMREVVADVPGVWSPVSVPEPFYDRPDPIKLKWVRTRDFSTGLIVTWKHKGETGGSPLIRYSADFKARTPLGKPRPTFECADKAYRCTVLNMIENRRTYWITLKVSNGHRWSRGFRFWVCTGPCE